MRFLRPCRPLIAKNAMNAAQLLMAQHDLSGLMTGLPAVGDQALIGPLIQGMGEGLAHARRGSGLQPTIHRRPL